MISEKRKRQKKNKAEGKCINCSKLRGDDGTTDYCRSCANKHNKCVYKTIARIIAEGKCKWCCKLRGSDGTAFFCRSCANKSNERGRKWRAKQK